MTNNQILYDNLNTETICKQEKSFSLTESIFAWLCYFCSYVFCRCFPVFVYPLGGFIFISLIYLISIVFLKIEKLKFNISSIIVGLSGFIISLSLLITTNSFLHFWSFLYAFASYCYFVYAVLNNRIEKGFSNLILLDFFKALIILPFASLGKIFIAMFTGKAKASGKLIGKIFLGIAITIIPTIIVVSLLSYDSNFIDLLDKIIDFDILNIFSHISSFGFAIPISMYFFGLYASSSENKGKDTINADACKKAYQSTKFVPSITVVIAVIPLVFLYVVFFISQWEYYVSGFIGTLPNEFSYAEFAREGFFELCVVSVINFIIIISIVLFMKRDITRPSIILKIITVVFSLCTLILISTAIAKMFMYIQSYGLTPKRVYATWLMILIGAIFIVIIISQFISRLKAVAISFVITVVFLTVLSLSNVDGMIAKYNINRYIDGSLNTVDMCAMEDLGDAAIPELVRLAEHLDNMYNSNISSDECLVDDELYNLLYNKLHSTARKYKHTENHSVFEENIAIFRAKSALKKVKL